MLVVVWFMFGRGALIVYKHKKDEGVPVPEGMDKDQIMDLIKKDAMYPDIKTFYFDENGDICVEGKYDTYTIEINEGKMYVNDPMLEEEGAFECGNKAVSFLANVGYWKIRFKRRNQKRVEEIECVRAYVAKALDHNAPVNANRKYADMVKARKYYTLIGVVGIVLAVVLLVVSFTIGAQNQKINEVKNAYLKSYSTEVTIGDAFENFVSNPVWKTYAEESKEYVEFSGRCTFDGDPANIVIRFEVQDDIFWVDRITVNGGLYVWEDDALTAIYEDYYFDHLN